MKLDLLDKLNFNLRRLAKLVNPSPMIGGLEISDSGLRYLVIQSNKVFKASVALEPGVVVGGRVKDREKLLAAARKLRLAVGPERGVINVILSCSPGNVYSQTFSIPALIDKKRIEEAVQLNLQAISPIDVRNAYYDAQELREVPTDGGQLEFLAAFIESQIIDDFNQILMQAKFRVVAIEFPALSLARLIVERGGGLDFGQAHLVLHMSEDGMKFLILVQGFMYFQYFLSWETIREGLGRRKIEIVDVKNAILREVRRLLNFYIGRFGGQPAAIIFISPTAFPDIEKELNENFAIKIQPLALVDFGDLSASWFVAAGAALRGLISRSQDSFISLAAVGTEEDYYQTQTLHFISFWRNIIITTLGFVAVVFVISDSLLAQTQKTLDQELTRIAVLPNAAEVGELQKEVEDFNRLVRIVGDLDKSIIDWTPFLEKMMTIARNNKINYDRIFVTAEKRVAINARADSETAAINFKNQMLQDKNFQNVVLPLAGIAAGPGEVTFSVNFEVVSF